MVCLDIGNGLVISREHGSDRCINVLLSRQLYNDDIYVYVRGVYAIRLYVFRFLIEVIMIISNTVSINLL